MVLVSGQILTKFFIEPIHKQYTLIGEIADALTYYADVYGNASSVREELKGEPTTLFRRQASQLRAITTSIHLYRLWSGLGLVPARANVSLASNSLIGLSNGIFSGDNHLNDGRARDIERLLRLVW